MHATGSASPTGLLASWPAPPMPPIWRPRPQKVANAGVDSAFYRIPMLQVTFNQGVGPAEVKLISDKVQAECIAMKMAPKNGFILLFVVDELSSNIMEHAHATWMDLKIDTSEKKFTA